MQDKAKQDRNFLLTCLLVPQRWKCS